MENNGSKLLSNGTRPTKLFLEDSLPINSLLDLHVQRMPIGQIMWDTDFKVCSWNPASEKIFGYTAEEALGKHPYELMVPLSSKVHVEQIWRRLLEGDSTAHSINENTTKAGNAIICKWSNTPLKTKDNRVIGVLSMVEDITERTKMEEEIHLVRSLTLGISIAEDFSSALKITLRNICESTGWVYGEAWVIDRETQSLVCSPAYYCATVELEDFRAKSELFSFPLEKGLPGKVWASRQSLWMTNVTEDPAFIRASLAREFGLKAAVGIPIVANGDVLAVMNFFLDKQRDQDNAFVNFLSTIATTLGLLFQRKHAEDALRVNYQKLKKMLEDTTNVLSSSVQTRDPYTAGHQKRVASIACSIAKEMELPSNTIEGIRVSGLLHDIGKLSVPIEILSKPGKISGFEFNIIKAHASLGCELLRTVDYPWPVADIVLQHHERWDGSGYPQGLKNGEILLEARILAVADAVEAMASHRPYRPALGIDKAREEIINNKGVLFDPDVVDACVRLFAEKGFKLEGV